MLQLLERDAKFADKGAYDFGVKPPVRLMAMYTVLGCAVWIEAGHIPALATVAAMCIAMALIDQRTAQIDHDFGPKGDGDARFDTPHGALLNFGVQVLLIIIRASLLISSIFIRERHERILENPVTVSGTIAEARTPDDEGMTIDGGYFWYVDV